MLRELTQQLHRSLPADMRPHCEVANLRGNTLVLIADSPAWASRLRYLSKGILRQVASNHKRPPQRLQVRIAPIQPTAPRSQPARRLSPESASALKQLAESTDDPLLAASLRKLASRTRD